MSGFTRNDPPEIKSMAIDKMDVDDDMQIDLYFDDDIVDTGANVAVEAVDSERPVSGHNLLTVKPVEDDAVSDLIDYSDDEDIPQITEPDLNSKPSLLRQAENHGETSILANDEDYPGDVNVDQKLDEEEYGETGYEEGQYGEDGYEGGDYEEQDYEEGHYEGQYGQGDYEQDYEEQDYEEGLEAEYQEGAFEGGTYDDDANYETYGDNNFEEGNGEPDAGYENYESGPQDQYPENGYDEYSGQDNSQGYNPTPGDNYEVDYQAPVDEGDATNEGGFNDNAQEYFPEGSEQQPEMAPNDSSVDHVSQTSKAAQDSHFETDRGQQSGQHSLDHSPSATNTKPVLPPIRVHRLTQSPTVVTPTRSSVSKSPLDVPDVIMYYNEVDMPLFETEGSGSGYLADRSLANKSLKILLENLKSDLNISNDLESELKVPVLDVTFLENTDACAQVSIREINDIYMSLNHADGISHPPTLTVYLAFKRDVMYQWYQLRDAARQGVGLSQFRKEHCPEQEIVKPATAQDGGQSLGLETNDTLNIADRDVEHQYTGSDIILDIDDIPFSSAATGPADQADFQHRNAGDGAGNEKESGQEKEVKKGGEASAAVQTIKQDIKLKIEGETGVEAQESLNDNLEVISGDGERATFFTTIPSSPLGNTTVRVIATPEIPPTPTTGPISPTKTLPVDDEEEITYDDDKEITYDDEKEITYEDTEDEGDEYGSSHVLGGQAHTEPESPSIARSKRSLPEATMSPQEPKRIRQS